MKPSIANEILQQIQSSIREYRAQGGKPSVVLLDRQLHKQLELSLGKLDDVSKVPICPVNWSRRSVKWRVWEFSGGLT